MPCLRSALIMLRFLMGYGRFSIRLDGVCKISCHSEFANQSQRWAVQFQKYPHRHHVTNDLSCHASSHRLSTNHTSSRNTLKYIMTLFPPTQLLFNMSNHQPWARLLREFERNPPTEHSIIQSLNLVLPTQTPSHRYQIYNYILELFTHGRILPHYLHIIYKHFHPKGHL